jgi:hypothetical protein
LVDSLTGGIKSGTDHDHDHGFGVMDQWHTGGWPSLGAMGWHVRGFSVVAICIVKMEGLDQNRSETHALLPGLTV